MTLLQYLLDENVDPLYWCEAHRFMLVTNNRKSIPGHLREHLARGHHLPAIIALNPVLPVGDTLDDLWLIATVADEPQYRDRIVYLPL